MLDPCGVDVAFVVVGVVAVFASFEVYVVAGFFPRCRNRSLNNRFVSLPLSVRAEKKAKKKKKIKKISLWHITSFFFSSLSVRVEKKNTRRKSNTTMEVIFRLVASFVFPCANICFCSVFSFPSSRYLSSMCTGEAKRGTDRLTD